MSGMRAITVVLLSACGTAPMMVPEDAGVVGSRPDAGPSDGGCTPTTFADACAAVERAKFLSVDKLECGLCPGGDGGISLCQCNWSVTFDGDRNWSWHHSDVFEHGAAGCSGFDLTVDGGGGSSARYDPLCDTLEWKGVLYRYAR